MVDYLIEPAFILPWWLWAIIGGLLILWGQKATGKSGKILMGIGVIIVLISLLGTLFVALAEAPPRDRLENRPLDFDYIIALDSSIFNFPNFATDDDPADARQMDVNDNTKTVILNVTIDDSANTVVPDSWGLSVTMRRIDAGWKEAGVSVGATCLVMQSNSEFPKVLNNNSLAQDLVAKDTNFIYQVAWEDFADNPAIGKTNMGAIGELGPGESDIFTWAVYLWEANLQSNIPAQTLTWNTDIVMSADAIGTTAQGTWTDSFSFGALFSFQL